MVWLVDGGSRLSIPRSRWFVVALLLAASCSGKTSTSSQGSSAPTPSPTPSTCVGKIVPITFQCPISEIGKTDLTGQGQDVTVTIQAGEGVFGPTYIRTKPGAHVTVTLASEFSEHTFTIDSLGVNEAIPAGGRTVSFTLPGTGPVIFYCIPHRARGMQGAFYFS
jgi:plastocyanin